MVDIHHLRYHVLLLVLLVVPVHSQEEGEQPITVGAQVTAVQIGDTGEIQCAASNNTNVVWYRGANGTAEKLISQNDSSRVHANRTTGTLTVRDAIEDDKGEYLCQTADGNHSVTAELHVYQMPTYFTEGMIIFGINIGLLVVFFSCALYTFIQNRKLHTTATKTKESKADETNPQKVSTNPQRVSTEL